MSQSLFTVQTPSLTNESDAAPGITRGMSIEFAKDGTVSAIRWWCPTTNTGTYTVAFWDLTSNTSGTLLGSVVHSGTPTGGAWNVTPLTTPVNVLAAAKTYRIGVFNDQGRYVATTGVFGSPLVNGDLTAPADGSTCKAGFSVFNGAFNISGALSFPTSHVGPTNYFVDVVYDPTAAGVELAATLTATGSMTAGLTSNALLGAGLTATGSLSAGLTSNALLSAGLTATGSLSAGLTSNPQLAAGLTATGSMTAALKSNALLGAGLTATGNLGVTFSGTSQVNLAANLAMNGSLSVGLTVPQQQGDPIGLPVAEQLLACLTEQLQTLPSPPANIHLRLGQETGPLIGPNTDECCAGLAWVRISQIYPSWDSFPGPDNTWLPCGPLAYAVVLEMGVAFCMPWSDTSGTYDDMDPPSAQDWATAAATQMQHQTLMRRAAACCFRTTQRRAVGEWSSLPVEGGCTGGKLTVTVSVMNPCMDC